MTVADLNRDGRPDIITAHNDPDGLVVLTNRGERFDRWFISAGSGPFDVTSGDLDKDGFPDLAVADADGNTIILMFGMPGGFRHMSYVGAVGKPRGLTISDMDRDGNPDVIYTAYYNKAVQILYGDGTGRFAIRRGPITVGLYPQGVASADFNEDGWNDLAVASSGSVGLTILYQTPGGTGFSRRDLAAPTSQNVVTVGDFNRDGRPDIAAASTATTDITVFINGRNSSSILVYPSGGGSPRGIVAADLNRDGAPEIVTGNRATSTVQILPAHGDGTFGDAYGIAAGSGSRTVAVADFNNDGRPDIASGNEYSATATILTNTTDFPRAAYAFSRRVIGGEYSGYSSSNGVAVADFDLDGKYDIVTVGRTSGAIMLRGNGASTPIPAYSVGAGLAAANLNGDGRPDLLVLDVAPYPIDLSVLSARLGDGTGGFSATRTTQAGVHAFDMALGDLNGDGRTDAVLVGSTTRTDSSQTRVESWLGKGDGTFTLASTVTTPRTYTDLVLGDMDRDGDLDAITYGNSLTTSQPTAVYSWLNDSAGRFSATPRVATIADWHGIYGSSVGDVNLDGYLDYIATGYPLEGGLENGAAVLLGGTAGFGAPTYFGTRGSPPPHIADLTMDGHPDVMTEDGYLYPGRGDGTFDPPEGFDFFAPGMAILDFDRKGLLDVIGPDADGSAQIILNQHRDDNRQPTIAMGPDRTIGYADQFGEEDNDITIQASDPDLHKLVFSVYDEDGNLVQAPSPEKYFTLPTRIPGRHEFTVVADDGRGASARDTFAVTVLPLKEIVIHTAAQYPWFQGDAWSILSDSTAAAGGALHDRNAGAPKVNAPLASPSDYAEIYFVADPTQTYKLWVRLKADGNSWANDSLWLQFDGAVDGAGRSYQPGTSSGIAINLEECSGCGLSGWGWRDDAWGQRNVMGTMTLRFPRGGGQMLRIQTREDGVKVDQIVLSAAKYRTTRPGTVKNDTVILPWTPF